MANKTFSNWLAGLAQASVSPGDLVPVVQGGVSKRAPAGQAGGIATLDAAGKLAQPRRVLAVLSELGTTSNPSTTADIGAYILPDPRITINGYSGKTALVSGFVSIYVSNDWYFLAQLMYSTDGGATWAKLGRENVFKPGQSANVYFVHPLTAVLTLPSDSVLIGISIGNLPSGGYTVTAAQTRRALLAVIADY